MQFIYFHKLPYNVQKSKVQCKTYDDKYLEFMIAPVERKSVMYHNTQ